MKNPLPKLILPVVLAAALPGCTQLAKLIPVDAAAEATEARNAYQIGDYRTASTHIRNALSRRDDVSEYWIIAGRIAFAQDQPGSAYQAYQNALLLDRANVEALQALCLVGPSVGPADAVDQYADQLLLLQPKNPVPLAAKGSSALRRNDYAAALSYAAKILAIDPQNARGLVLKAQTLMKQRHSEEVAPLLENALKTAPTDVPILLSMLKRIYGEQLDREKYESTVTRLADAEKDSAAAQLDYADLLYQKGQNAAAQQRLVALMQRQPRNPETQQAILELWLTQGSTATPLDRLVSDGQGVSPLMRSAYGAYANAMGRPDLTRTLLAPDVAKNGKSPADLDAKAVYAEALAMSHSAAQAAQLIEQVLKVDSSQPKALMARARLALATGNTDTALADARAVTGSYPRYVSAQLLLADILHRRGEKELVNSALRQALEVSPADPRLTLRLANALLAAGNHASAADLLQDSAKRAPMNQRIARLREGLCGKTGVSDCNAPLVPGRVIEQPA